MKHQKPLIRRTFLQERFEILIKRQLSGEATFAELTELDEIANRDPKIRHIILEEMDEDATPQNGPRNEQISPIQPMTQPSLAEKIKVLVRRWFDFTAIEALSGC